MKTDVTILAIVGVFALGGCTDMKDQPRVDPLEESAFFEDGRAARLPVEGTVARGHLQEDPHLFRGLDEQGQFVDTLPFPITDKVLRRGQERYDIFCSPCHDRTGSGEGMIVQRGYKTPPSFHDERLRHAPLGYLFDVSTNGFNTMRGYATQVRPSDRWAIVAYLRALQLSQHSEVTAAPAEVQRRLEHEDVVDLRAPEEEVSHAGH